MGHESEKLNTILPSMQRAYQNYNAFLRGKNKFTLNKNEFKDFTVFHQNDFFQILQSVACSDFSSIFIYLLECSIILTTVHL